MMVEILSRQREKIIAFITFHGWATTRDKATIKEIGMHVTNSLGVWPIYSLWKTYYVYM